GRKLLRKSGIEEKSEVYLSNQLTNELNLVITGSSLAARLGEDVGPRTREQVAAKASDVAVNRAILVDRFGEFIAPPRTEATPVPFSDMTVLDVLVADDLRRDFITESENLLLFDSVYDQII